MSDKTSVLFLTRRFFPQIGGVESHVMSVSKILVSRGYNVTILTEELQNQSLKNINAQIDGIKVIRIKAGIDDWFKKFRIWWQLWSLRRLFDEADTIHCHDVFFWYLPLRIVHPNRLVYTTFHGYETKFPPSRKAIIVRRLSKRLSYGNICIGDFIEKWYGTKPDYISYGGVSKIKNPKLKVKSNNTKFKIVLIGRLEKDMGTQTYINALKILKKRKIDFNFEVYGEGSLGKKINKFGKMHGFIDKVGPTMTSADIVFCSSYLTMLEALAAKKLVIAVYENALKEDYLRLSPFAQFIYMCKDEQEVVMVINSIQKDAWKSKTMIENGYKWAIEQTWDKVAGIYLQLWKL